MYKSFSQYFKLGKTQQELDFVDIPVNNGDIQLFIDPYAIGLKNDAWSIEAHNLIVRFFQHAIDKIRQGELETAKRMLDALREPNFTRLGMSVGDKPRGNGVSGDTALDLFNGLKDSSAVKTGLLQDLEDCELLIPGISKDKISDIATNLIKSKLIEYTQSQCNLHSVPIFKVSAGKIWDETAGEWRSQFAELPVCNDMAVILVPRHIVRFHLNLSAQEYYNQFVLNYLQSEEFHSGSSLARVLRSGEKRPPYKKDLKKKYPPSKDFLFGFSLEHPDEFSNYKQTKAAKDEAMPAEDIVHRAHLPEESNLNSDTLIRKLEATPRGSASASSYHNLMIGTLTYIFFPQLINPQKEKEINQGRKRIDILFTNAARTGFFELLKRQKGIHCPNIMVECKNYSNDPANPELDQLLGRFSLLRGSVGFLVCRALIDKPLLYQRCRDAALNKHELIIPLDDEDIKTLIKLRAEGNEQQIDLFLEAAYQKLVM